MKNRTRRLLSVFLAASMVLGHGNVTTLAEGTAEPAAETVVETEAVVAAAEEAPATEAPTEKPTEAPTEPPTEPPTEAPTEAPTEPPTEAPTEAKTETVTEAPATDAPEQDLIETEATVTEAPVTEAPSETAAEAPTEAVTEKVTEKATETVTEKETEAKKDTFTWSEDGLTVTVKLSKKDMLPESAQLSVTKLTKKSDKDSWKAADKLLKKEVNQGHRELSLARYYEIALTVDGQQVELSEKAEVTFTYEKALSLELSEYAQPEAKVFVLNEKAAKEIGELKLNDSLKVKKAEFNVKDSLLVAIAGIQNRENDGEKITQSGLEKVLGDALDYAVVANEYTGSMTEGVAAANVPMTASEEEDDFDVAEILASLKDYALVLANGKSSDSVKVINLYTDEDGEINTEPLEEVLTEDSVDVSGTTLVINIVAGEAEQDLTIPVYDAEYEGSEVANELASYAGRIIYNIVAEDEDEFVSYLGEAQLDGDAVGTYLAPEASVKSSDKVLGAVYGNKVAVSQVEKAVVGADGKKADTEKETEAAETETDTEEATEAAEAETSTEKITEAAETETDAEEVTEATETETDTEKVTETENVTEEVTEAEETEIETEDVTEVSSEIATEISSETTTEAVTESETEEFTEEMTETETELDLIEETELETEIVLAEESVELMTLDLAATETVTVKSLPVTKIENVKEPINPFEPETSNTVTETALSGATLTVLAAEDVVALADGKVLGKDGKETSFTAGATVYEEGAEIYTWTSSTTATDISSYLVAGGSYVLREKASPDVNKYMKGVDFNFSIGKDGIAKDVKGNTLTEIRYENVAVSTGSSSGDSSQTAASALSLKVAVAEKAENGGNTTLNYLAGAEFVIKDAEGNLLKDVNGNAYTFASEAGIMTLNLNTELYTALTNGWTVGTTVSNAFYITQIKASSKYQISGYSEAEIIVAKDEDGKVTITLPAGKTIALSEDEMDKAVIFYNTKVPTGATGSISVTKRNYYSDTETQIYATKGATYYAALFADEAKTVRVSDVKAIEIKKGYKAATILFDNLANGTYYVGETDEYGNVVNEEKDKTKGDYYAEYVYDSIQKKVVIDVDEDAAFDADAEKVTIKNRYFEVPKDFVYTVTFNVKLNLLDENGAALTSKSTFYAGVYSKNSASEKYTFAGKKAVKMNGKSEQTITIELPMPNTYKYVKVKLVDSNGNEIKSGTSYSISISPAELTLKQGDTATKTVTITAQRLASAAESESETEAASNSNEMKAELKLTKKVTYKNTAIRVNSVYYIGIFDDAALTKLRYKKAMTFANASELTATLKVNLHKLASKEVTFYFAEVDEDGNVLKGGSDFGYDITLNKNSITLNAQNMNDELIITNSVVEGASVEQQLTSASSGLAGDSAALATAQNLASSSNSSENTTTGDDNPILQLILILIASIVVIIVIVIVIIVRRRNRRKKGGPRRY